MHTLAQIQGEEYNQTEIENERAKFPSALRQGILFIRRRDKHMIQSVFENFKPMWKYCPNTFKSKFTNLSGKWRVCRQ